MTAEEIRKNIESITELLYQVKTVEAYDKLNGLIGTLTVYVGTVTDEEKQLKILEALKEALAAMEAKDNTELADVLQYELMDLID